MRLWGRTLSDIQISDMANNMGNPINIVKKGEQLTLTEYKKNANNGYYYTVEYNGWVPSNSIKIERDIEFLYTSSLTSTLKNRARVMSMTLNNDTSSDKKSGNDVSTFVASKKSTPNEDKYIKENNERHKNDPKPEVKIHDKYGKLAAGIGAKYLGNSAVTNIANTFIADGDWKSTMNGTSVNQLLNLDSGSMLGQILNGATIGNIANGSFFLKGLFDTEGLLNNLYRLALSKLSYVIGKQFSSKWYWLLDLTGNIFFGDSFFGSIGKNFSFQQIHYAPITQDMINYFRYKGCDYRMITRTFGTLMRWEQDESYSTPSLQSSKDPDEVKFYRELYNANYSEYADVISIARDSVNLDIDRQDWFVNFNRYRLCHPDSELTNTISYVFFTRPDLNLKESLSGISVSGLAPFLYNMIQQHPVLTNSLTKGYSGVHQFLPYLCNKVRSIDIQDEQIKTREIGETLTGFKISYAYHNIESLTANTTSISFAEDEQLSTYLLFKIWEEYMSGVSRGIIYPNLRYIRTKQLDYACSIYYFLCGPDGESILFWSKFTGAFPTNVPSSSFSMQEAEKVRHPIYNITWQYSEKRDYNPLHLAEFNNLTSSDYEYIKPYSPDIFRSAPTLQGAPFVDTNTAGRLFKLRFRQPIS